MRAVRRQRNMGHMSYIGYVVLAGCVLTAMTLAGEASAQALSEQSSVTWRHTTGESIESPQHWAFELRFGHYTPKIDDEFGGSGPYKQVFGTDKRWFGGLELDYQALRIPYVGTLGPGISWAYTHMNAGTKLSGTDEASTEDTSLWIMPMYLAAVLRVDVLSREFRVPLVPHLKLGFSYALWETSNGSGTSRYESGGDSILGRGSSYGWNLGLGLAVQLDPIDRHSARQLDNNTGINHSYVFAEWMYLRLDGFGKEGIMQVGTSTWVIGLAFEI